MSKGLEELLHGGVKSLFQGIAQLEIVNSPSSRRIWRQLHHHTSALAKDIYEQFLSGSEEDPYSEKGRDEKDVDEKGKEQQFSRTQAAHLATCAEKISEQDIVSFQEIITDWELKKQEEDFARILASAWGVKFIRDLAAIRDLAEAAKSTVPSSPNFLDGIDKFLARVDEVARMGTA